MTLSWHWTLPASTGLRADRALLEALEQSLGSWEPDRPDPLPVISRSQMQKWMEDGRVRLGGRPIKSNLKLKAGDQIQIDFPAPKPMGLVAEDRPLDILYQDEHLVVVNKPPGLTVHPSTTQFEGTLVHALLHHIQDLSGIGGVLRPGIVHRLDKDTSGALVITKTDAAHRKLSEVFSRHAIERRYWALCYGHLTLPSTQKELKVESLIGRSPTDRKKMSMTVKEGRQAITYIKPLEAYGSSDERPFATLVEARLETGRTHQVRVHLTGVGHSLLGDPAYGTPSLKNTKWVALPKEVQAAITVLPGQALHARVLGFDHPITGQPLRFEAEPPEAFRLLLSALQRYR